MSSVFSFENESLDPKIFITSGDFASYTDPEEISTKKAPWRQIRNSPFIYSASIIMPTELYQSVYGRIDERAKKSSYAKVVMKLEELLEGEFFNEYIKRGMPNCRYL